jgi:hypothetical protein
MNRRSRTIRILGIVAVVVSAVCFIVMTNVKSVRTNSDYVWFEAESAIEVERPVVVSEDPDASGGKCLEIVQGTGSGVYGSGGKATYEVSLPEKGKYILWARVYWLDGCGNSFLIKIGGNTFQFGEDSNFNVWHWVFMIAPEFETSGKHEIQVINREDGIKIDRFLLTKDATYAPTGIGERMYYFSFDGGRADGWKPRREELWSVEDSEGIDGSSVYYLKPLGGGSREFSVTSVDPLKEFVYRVQAACSSDDETRRDVRLLLKDRGKKGYLVIDFKEGHAALKRCSGDTEEEMCSADPAQARKIILGKAYHLYEVRCKDGLIEVSFDGFPVLGWNGNLVHGGAVGVGSLFGGVCFDNILYAGSLEFDYSNNFYHDREVSLDRVAGWQSLAGDWTRNATYGTDAYRAGVDTVSVSTSGLAMWSDYSYEAAFRADGRSTVGLLFYFLNKDNSYLFQWRGNDTGRGAKELIRIFNGSAVLLGEEPGGYTSDQWYLMRVEVLKGKIRAFIDGALVFDVADAKLFQGKIGLVVKNGPEALERAPEIQFWPGVYCGDTWQWFANHQAEKKSSDRIFFCYQGEDDHYSLRRMIGVDGARVMRLFQTKQGKSVLLEEKSDITANLHSHQYVIERRADSISVMILAPLSRDYLTIEYQEVMRFTIRNPIFTQGRIGMDTGRPATAEFDDIRERSIGEIAIDGKEWWSDGFPGRALDRTYSGSPSSRTGEGRGSVHAFDEWRPVGGTWRVENGELIGISGEHGSFVRYVLGPLHDDVSLEMSARSVSGTDAAIGMIIAGDRYDTAKGYRMEFAGRGATLYKNASAVYSSRDGAFEPGKDYSLKFEMKGEDISGYCNGGKIFTFHDDAPIRGGEVLVASAGGTVAIDSIAIAASPYLHYGFEVAKWAATDFTMWDIVAGKWDEIPSLGYRVFGEKVNEHDAILWHRRTLPNDFAIDMYLAAGDYTRTGQAIIRFCAKRECDNCGYKLLLDFTALEEAAGAWRFDYRATLLKNGRVCGRAAKSAKSAWPQMALRIEKMNGSTRIILENDAVLGFADDDAPQGNMIALGVGGAMYHPVFFDEIYIAAR